MSHNTPNTVMKGTEYAILSSIFANLQEISGKYSECRQMPETVLGEIEAWLNSTGAELKKTESGLKTRLDKGQDRLEHLHEEYSSFCMEYHKLVENAYYRKVVNARKWYEEENARLQKEADDKCVNSIALSDEWEARDAELKKLEKVYKKLEAETGKAAAELKVFTDEVEALKKVYDKAKTELFMNHKWYYMKVDVVPRVIFNKIGARIELPIYVTGWERVAVRLYGALLAFGAVRRLKRAAVPMFKAQARCNPVQERYDSIAAKRDKAKAEYTRALDDIGPLDDKMEKVLGATEEIMDKAESFNKTDYLKKPLSPELVRNDVFGRLAISTDELKGILKTVKAAKGYPLETEAQARSPFPNIYLDKKSWTEWVDSRESVHRKALEEDIRTAVKSISDVRSRMEYLQKEYERKIADLTSRREELERSCSEEFAEWRKRFEAISDPALVPVLPEGEVSQETARLVCGRIAAKASGRTVMPVLPVGFRHFSTIAGTVTVPYITRWHDSGHGGKYNFLIEYSDSEKKLAADTMNDLLMHMLMSFPAKKLRFTFVDLNITNMASLFTINLDPLLYHNNPIVKEQDFRRKLDELQDRMVSVSKHCSDLLAYNEKKGVILFPYEVVVLLDYPDGLSPQVMNQLGALYANGHKGGVFFVVLRRSGEGISGRAKVADAVDAVHFTKVDFLGEDKSGQVFRYFRLASTPVLARACFSYINAEAQKEEKARSIDQNMEDLYGQPMVDAASSFMVPVGENNSRISWFRLDEASHAHAFVLGQSGSGKSVFLHNIICNAALKYSPDSLQMYLLDFKLGGVEFNRYRDVKHVKALLVDNSDQQITLEILRDLYETMRRRGELLRNAGVSSLRGYNDLFPDARLPRIILAVDECHELFRDRIDRTQGEINAIVTKIAKEGRSQGVHLLFATQTLANANIPSELLNNVSDYYLLKCAQTDAEKLVRDSSKLTSALTTGWLLYAHEDKREIFQAYYAGRERMDENLARIQERTSDFIAGDRFFFSGKQSFPLDSSVLAGLSGMSKRTPSGFMGRSIDLSQSPVGFRLGPRLSENVLYFGINTGLQTTRTVLDTLVTLIASYRRLSRECDFYVINCLNLPEEGPHESLLVELEKCGCAIVDGSDRGKLLSGLADKVRNHTAADTVVVILGQERFRELRLEMPLEPAKEAASGIQTLSASHLGANLGALRPREEKRTYRSELRYLLENGPEQNVHFLLQVDKPSNLLFENVISQQTVYSMFKHIVMLKSAPEAALKLRLSDEIKLEQLSDEDDRLRAYYYNDDEGAYTLFTPYALPSADIMNGIA